MDCESHCGGRNVTVMRWRQSGEAQVLRQGEEGSTPSAQAAFLSRWKIGRPFGAAVTTAKFLRASTKTLGVDPTRESCRHTRQCPCGLHEVEAEANTAFAREEVRFIATTVTADGVDGGVLVVVVHML